MESTNFSDQPHIILKLRYFKSQCFKLRRLVHVLLNLYALTSMLDTLKLAQHS